MTTARIHCQVLEVASQNDRRARHGCPRDLLPWADPYIAGLIRRLEDRYNVEDGGDDLSDPFAADDESARRSGLADWQEDADAPALEASRPCCYPPVYGGFPLIDDVGEGDDADAY